MKKLLLFLLLTNVITAQINTIQVTLVDSNIGSVVSGSPFFSSCGVESNDVGLNAIFQNHNAHYYCGYGFFPINATMESYASSLLDCDCDPNLLVADLTAYSSVVKKARVSPEQQVFANLLNIKVINPATTPYDVDANHIVITNDSATNLIFQNHNVFTYTHLINNWYQLNCDCNANELAEDLLEAGIALPNSVNPETNQPISENIWYEHMMYLLGNANFENTKPNVSPNPFTTRFDIVSNITIDNYSLSDIAGKQIITTNSKLELDDKSSQLTSGLYFLKLSYDNGKSSTHKLVKN